ncbi:MAG: SPOR domain-containing protein [Pseudomonadota bacterium]
MSRRTIARLALAAGALLVLSGCQKAGFPFAPSGARQDATAAAADGGTAAVAAFSLVERDVEAPDVFSLKDKGLWDGRPSLGGVWVAHATVKDPERVIIRNAVNGKSVIGALFRREAQNPGPSLQVSSDAAAALGMLAGQPAELAVVALRREQPTAPEASAAAAEVVSDGAATGTVAAAGSGAGAGADQAPAGKPPAGIDPIAATAAAAIDRAEGKTADAAAAGADAATAAAATSEGAASAVAEAGARKCPFWRKRKCLADQAAASAGADPALPPAAGAVTSAALGPVGESIPATPTAAAVLTRPYVQIGIFSLEANARRAADQMQAGGMAATVKADRSQGKSFWRVIVGPAASVSERDGLAARVKGIGYPDAYPVSR